MHIKLGYPQSLSPLEIYDSPVMISFEIKTCIILIETKNIHGKIDPDHFDIKQKTEN